MPQLRSSAYRPQVAATQPRRNAVPQLFLRQPEDETRQLVARARDALGLPTHPRPTPAPAPAPPQTQSATRQRPAATALTNLQRALRGKAFAEASALLRRHRGLRTHIQVGHIVGQYAQANDGDALRAIFAAEVPIDIAVSQEGDTALFVAIAERHHTLLDELIRMGANVDWTDCKGITPLYYASTTDNMLAAAKLLRAGARADVVVNGFAAVHAAIVLGHLHIAQLLFRQAGKEVQDEDGQSPLQTAIRRQHWTSAARFIAEGANVHHVDDMGCSILTEASAAAHPPTVRALLNAGARPTRAFDGPTALGMAVESLLDADNSTTTQNVLQTVTLLLGAGANANEPSISQTTPLLVAAAAGNLSVVRALADAGADLLHHGDKGANCAGVAAAAGHVPVLQFLMERGVTLTQRDGGGNLPLHLAAQHGEVVALDFLLEHGQTLATQNHLGAVPLSVALYHNQLQAAHAIMAKMDFRQRLGRFDSTPLHLVVTLNAAAIPLLAACCSTAALRDMLAATSLSGMTVYHAAVMLEDETCLPALLALDSATDKASNVSRATYHGFAPLDFALSTGDTAAVRQILPHTQDAYFSKAVLPEGLADLLALDRTACWALLLQRETVRRCLRRHAGTALDIVCEAGFPNVIRLLFPVLRPHVVEDPGDNASNLLHKVAKSQSISATRAVVEMLGRHLASSLLRHRDEDGHQPATLARAPGLQRYLQNLRRKGDARAQAQAHHVNRSLAERQVVAIWQRWEALFSNMPANAYASVEQKTANLIRHLRTIQTQTWDNAANASAREPINSALQAVCLRVANFLDHLHVNHGVGWGMGHHFGAHAPTASFAQLNRRLVDAALPGSSRFTRSSMLALLEVRQQVVSDLELLQYQPAGRYIVEHFSSELRGEGYARPEDMQEGTTVPFAGMCCVRAVLEGGERQAPRLVSLYPVPRHAVLGKLGVARLVASSQAKSDNLVAASS